MKIPFRSIGRNVSALALAFTVVGGGCTLEDLTIGHAKDGATYTGDGGSAASDAAVPVDRPNVIDTAPLPDAAPAEQPVPMDAGAPTDAPAADQPSTVVDAGAPATTSPLVPGGSFVRSYDGVQFKDQGNPATVSHFRLDKHEVTVGRFRPFVAAVAAGWKPSAGSGKHTHLNDGQGLADSSAPGSFEAGWNAVWNNNLSATVSGWDAALACPGHGAFTWTPSAGANESMPINCVNWYQAYAYCIWDGGFLPSEAEWNYAASGGNEQRAYPWSVPPTSVTIDCSYANHVNKLFDPDGGAVPMNCGAFFTPGVGGVMTNTVGYNSPKGDGKWGHSDLAGNVTEWTLDWLANYSTPCVDCGYLSNAAEPVTSRTERGGSHATPGSAPQGPNQGGGIIALGSSVLASNRIANAPNLSQPTIGVRCARAP